VLLLGAKLHVDDAPEPEQRDGESGDAAGADHLAGGDSEDDYEDDEPEDGGNEAGGASGEDEEEEDASPRQPDQQQPPPPPAAAAAASPVKRAGLDAARQQLADLAASILDGYIGDAAFKAMDAVLVGACCALPGGRRHSRVWPPRRREL
jgi:hypothetical protein